MNKTDLASVRDIVNAILQEGYDLNQNFVFCAYTFFSTRNTLKDVTNILEGYGFETILLNQDYHVIGIHASVNDPVHLIKDLKSIGINAELRIDAPYAYSIKRE